MSLPESPANGNKKQSAETDFVTLLLSKYRLAVKRHVYDDHGFFLKTHAYDTIKTWDHRRVAVAGLKPMLEILRACEANSNIVVIRGKHQDERGEGAQRVMSVFEDAPHRWMMIDMDDVLSPFKVDPTSQESLDNAALSTIRTHLPEEFHGADVIVQWSQSAGVKPWEHLRLHLWFWLDKPLNVAQLKAWYKSDERLRESADLAMTSTNQVHYVGSPVFDGISDPFKLRAARLITGHRGEVVTPSVEAIATLMAKQETTPRKRSKSGGERDLFTVVAPESTNAYCRGVCRGTIRDMQDVDATNERGKGKDLYQPRHATILNAGSRLGSYYAGGGISDSEMKKTCLECEQLANKFREGEGRTFLDGVEIGKGNPIQANDREVEQPPEEIINDVDGSGPPYDSKYDTEWKCAVSDTRLAQRIIKTYTHPDFKRTDREIIFCADELWRADLLSHLWVKIRSSELGARMQRWDGQFCNGKPISLNLKHYNASITLLKGHLLQEEAEFFSSAPRGFVAGSKFIQVDILSGDIQTLPLSPKHRQRHMLDTEINISADNGIYGEEGTLLHRFLSTIHLGATDEQERLMAMGQLLWAALTHSGPHWHRAGFCFGIPGTGKSQFVEMVRELIPNGAVSALSPQNLSDERHTPGLDGVWLNAQTEVSSDFSDGTVLKAAIMGEIIRVNPKGKDAYDLTIEALFLFAGNDLPRFKGSLESIMDRWLPVQFERRVRDTDEDIKDIGKTIAQTEMAGLIEWAMFCGRKLMADKKYTIPVSSREIFNEWREDSDPVQTWLTDEVKEIGGEVDKKEWTTLTDVYESYSDWAKTAGYKSITRRTLSKRMRDSGMMVERITEGRVVNIKVTKPVKKDHMW